MAVLRDVVDERLRQVTHVEPSFAVEAMQKLWGRPNGLGDEKGHDEA